MAPTLSLESIHKRFGQTEALKGVTFTLEPGEIHALLGENGAGKSTLMKVAFGLVRPDAGSIAVNGRQCSVPDPRTARQLGIGMVHQHFTSIPAFTVAENVALAAGWAPHPRRARQRLEQLATETGLTLDPDQHVGALSAGLKQRLEVLKALAANATILLLDEPTSVLPPPEAAAFLDLVTSLRARGIAAVLITHKLNEALRIADRVTILRRGEVVRTGPVSAENPERLAVAMLGAAPERRAKSTPTVPGRTLVAANRLAVARLSGSGSGLRDATLEAAAGEVVGIAAVEGNGQRELFRAIAGLVQPDSGSLEVGQPVALIPEDRSSEALIGSFSLTENLVLRLGRSGRWIRRGWVDWRAARERTTDLLAAHSVQTAGPEATAASLSGGNQQRWVIASVGERHPLVLLAENPGRGLDLRAAAAVFARLRSAATNGAAVIVHLPDLDDLLELADRIVVLAAGVSMPVPQGATRDDIGRMMLGAGNDPTGARGL